MVLVLAGSYQEAVEWANTEGLKRAEWKFATRQISIFGFRGHYVRLERFFYHHDSAGILVLVQEYVAKGRLQEYKATEVDWRPTELIPEDYYAG